MLSFTLLIAAQAAGSAAAPPAVNPDSVVRCVREEVMGTLARTRKVCHTVGEWRQINRDTRTEADRLITDSMTKSGGN